ncbi:MAG TPA: response regulator [Flavisolibacter sp.]|nr:response regulator [Flavisolibacter sp.]
MNTSYTILYVDDDHDDLMLIAEAFEKYTSNLRVINAYNGQDAVSKLKTMKDQGSLPCLVIIDINMPVMNGKELLQKIRSNDDLKEVPVVLFSTSNNPKDKFFAQDLDADFITKPVTFSNLNSLVSQFVTRCKFEVTKRA